MVLKTDGFGARAYTEVKRASNGYEFAIHSIVRMIGEHTAPSLHGLMADLWNERRCAVAPVRAGLPIFR